MSSYWNGGGDPDFDAKTGICSDEPCIRNIFIGGSTSAPAQLTVQGVAVEKQTAQVAFIPSVWVVQWALFSGPPISAEINFANTGRRPGDFDPSTIRLNGSVPATEPVIEGDVLKVRFDRAAAVRSLGTAVSGTKAVVVVQGSDQGKNVFFTAQAQIDLVGIQVPIDIKPGSAENAINLGSNGLVPVAILSTPMFDARTVDPLSLTLAGAQVKVRGKGTLMVAVEDVNKDGLPDLVVHVSTDALGLSEQATQAVLEGKTNSGMPIVGLDVIKVVP